MNEEPPSFCILSEMRDFVLKKLKDNGKVVEQTEANVFVSGGRAMGGFDFSLLEKLVVLLGGAAGASRVAVDLGDGGLIQHVGQSGKVVSPQNCNSIVRTVVEEFSNFHMFHLCLNTLRLKDKETSSII